MISRQVEARNFNNSPKLETKERKKEKRETRSYKSIYIHPPSHKSVFPFEIFHSRNFTSSQTSFQFFQFSFYPQFWNCTSRISLLDIQSRRGSPTCMARRTVSWPTRVTARSFSPLPACPGCKPPGEGLGGGGCLATVGMDGRMDDDRVYLPRISSWRERGRGRGRPRGISLLPSFRGIALELSSNYWLIDGFMGCICILYRNF